MKDLYNREIDYLRISVTDRCNLRCLYCMPDGIETIEKSKIIRDEDIIQIINEASKTGIKKVRITGGEPLVRSGIYELIRKIRSVKAIEEVVLTTNGILLKGHVKELKDSGVSRVNLSIDSLRESTVNGIVGSTLDFSYLELIKELHEHNMTPIKINTVLLKGVNDHEVLDFYNFSDQYDCEVRFIELMPFESDRFNYNDYYISKEVILKRNSLVLSRKLNNVEYYTMPNSTKEIGFINAVSSKFCEDCNRLRLTSDGYIKPCLHSNKELLVKGKTDEDVLEVIKKAIKEKPKQHKLDKSYTNSSKRSMNKIGG